MQTKKWSELSKKQRTAISALIAVEAVVTTVAVVDLARRPAEQVRGPKPLWLTGFLFQPLGPVLYLTVGRDCQRTPPA
ncbi:MAG: PLDc N-terminal domain-containing protein [Actinomycetia bacterium]|nr:PLDc N-terminal domain-containing protein [Actinomycetes bacterium]